MQYFSDLVGGLDPECRQTGGAQEKINKKKLYYDKAKSLSGKTQVSVTCGVTPTMQSWPEGGEKQIIKDWDDKVSRGICTDNKMGTSESGHDRQIEKRQLNEGKVNWYITKHRETERQMKKKKTQISKKCKDQKNTNNPHKTQETIKSIYFGCILYITYVYLGHVYG